MTWQWPDAAAADQVFIILLFVGLAELVGAAGAGLSRLVTRSGRRGACGGRPLRHVLEGVPATPYDDTHLWRMAPWQPPGWVFAVAWAGVLYPLTGLAASVVYLRPHDAVHDTTWILAMAFWFAQLLFNGLWAPVYFAWLEPVGALVVLVAALGLTVADVVMMGLLEDWLAVLFMSLYAGWLLFALSLNAYTVARSHLKSLARVRRDYWDTQRARDEGRERLQGA